MADALTELHWMRECARISRHTCWILEMVKNPSGTLTEFTQARDRAEAAGFRDAAEYIQRCIDDLLFLKEYHGTAQ